MNQNGERLRGFEINTLTVIATESYEQFAENLQKEIEDDTGIRFGIVEAAPIRRGHRDGGRRQPAPLGFDQSTVLWEHLKTVGLVNAQGKVQDALRQGAQGRYPDPAGAVRCPIAAGEGDSPQARWALEIKNADERRQIKTRQGRVARRRLQSALGPN